MVLSGVRLTVLALLVLAGCESAGTITASGPSNDDESAYIKSDAAWGMKDGVAKVRVCWEDEGFAAEKAWVRAIVESRYERQPFFHVDFTDWDKCGWFTRGIRIQIADTEDNNGPRVKKLGDGLNGKWNGMVLNFTFEHWSKSACATNPAGDAARRRCIEWVGIHEFGHSLGLAHEQNRPDRPGNCNANDQGSEGDVLVGNFDINSAMAYCNPTWNNGGALSAGDVAGLARMYGGGSDVFVGPSTGTAFASGEARHDLFCLSGEVCLGGDVDGDGDEDLVAFTRGDAADAYVARSSGTAFGVRARWSDSVAGGSALPFLGDVDGDGKDDVVSFTRGAEGDVWVSLSTGTAFAPAAKWHDLFSFNDEIPRVGDVDGDGKADIVTFTRGKNVDVLVAVSQGTSFQGTAWKWHDNFCAGSAQCELGDVNGDGKADAVSFTRGDDANVDVALSTGKAFGGTTRWSDGFCGGDDVCTVADVTGDGKDDVVAFARGDEGLVWAAPSTGTAFAGGQWSTGFCLQKDECNVADVTGDGKADLVGYKR